MNNEAWKFIDGFGNYQISNLGRVKNFVTGKVLKPSIRNGYPTVIVRNSGNTSTLSVHRLVALSFVANTENKAQVNHKNGNKLDNRAVNLEWCTPGENIKHAYANGLASKKGEKNNANKLQESDLPKIKEMAGKFSQSKIAKMFGVTQPTISRLLSGKQWS